MIYLRVLGIDLGTSLSSIAIIEDGKAVPIRVGTAASLLIGDSYCLPSTVFIEENGEILFGQAADNSRMKDPTRYRKEFKRDLGTTEPYHIGDMSLFPEDLYKEFFKYFKSTSEERLGGSIDKVVITHPANFAGYKKELIKKACQMAGFLEVDLIDEPTAAAVYYSSKQKIAVGEKILVYDLGGGTFDVSLIQKEENGFRPLTPPLGIERCGGIDFQRKILEDIIETFSEEIRPILSQGGVGARRFSFMLETESVKIKHHLSTSFKAESVINLPGSLEFKTYEITRDKFQAMIKEDIEATCIKIEDIIKNAGIKMSELDKVLLVGGSSRIPYVEELVNKVTGKIASKDADTELVVALGAAIYGYQSMSNSITDRKDNLRSNIKIEHIAKNSESEDSEIDDLKNVRKTNSFNINNSATSNKNNLQMPESYKHFFKQSFYTSSQIVAIEIGGIFSRVAAVIKERPMILSNSNGESNIPTIISFSKDQCVIGADAKQKFSTEKCLVFRDINNLIRLGRKITLDGKEYRPEILYAFFIQKLKDLAEMSLKKNVDQVVLVTPLYFSYSMKSHIKEAAKIAGVEILRIIDSCTAHAINYTYYHGDEHRNYLLFNVGDSCTELSMLEVNKGQGKTTHKLGFNLNGSNDFTNRIVEYVVNRYRSSTGVDLSNVLLAMERIKSAAETAKEELRVRFETNISIPNIINTSPNPRHLYVDLKKSDYASLIADIANRIASFGVIGGTLGNKVNKILLSGEGASTPLLKERISSLTNKEVEIVENFKTAGVQGGAIYAAIISKGITNLLFEDCISKFIGIKRTDGKHHILIPKNRTVPICIKEVLTNTSGIEISSGVTFVEGDNMNGNDIEILDHIELDIDKMNYKLEIKLEVTSEEIIRVTLRNLDTGYENNRLL